MAKKRKVTPKPKQDLTRKELRKQQRQNKKQSRIKFFEAKRSNIQDNAKKAPGSKTSSSVEHCKARNPSLKTAVVEHSKIPKVRNSIVKTSHEKLLDKMKLQRKQQLLNANKDEEKEIKFLERRLKLANKKTISTSKGFSEAGLDYILDVCDSEKINSVLSSEVNFDDSDSDFFEDYSMIQKDTVGKTQSPTKRKKISNTDRNLTKKSKPNEVIDTLKPDAIDKSIYKKKVQFNSDISEDLDVLSDNKSLSSEEFSDGSGDEILSKGDISDNELDDGSLSSDDEKPAAPSKPEVWEDIYGRMRDQKGNILKQNDGKYIPPHLRNLEDSDELKKQRELMRQLKGLLNRLALNNIHSIANQVEELYSKNSRNSMNEALFNLYMNSLVTTVLSPERLIVDHAMLVATLHGNVGSEIGATMLQNLVQKFNSLLDVSQGVENKELDNLLLLISYLYNFKLFESVLMYDILNKLCSKFTEKNIDLILVVLKCVGFPLRKDDPIAMKAFLLSVQKQMNMTSEIEDRSRMKYMLEVLLSIKNNNVSKLSGFDPEQHEHLKKVLKSVVRTGNSIVALRIGLEDLLKAEERGRWWIVGSAWSNNTEEGQKIIKKDIAPREKFSSQLLDLAKNQRMNTDNRRNIFCILMSAEDYHDAFQKVLKLGLKGQQEREIPHVIIHCLLQEKMYNPYYGYIADQLCVSNRRHQMSFQCALWDKFRALEKLSPSKINCLAKFLAQILLAGSIPISVLKVVEFTELDKQHTRLLRQTILTIANEEAKDSMSQVFLRVSKSKKLSLFREALRLFVHHFLLRNMPEGDLKERVSLINSILMGDVN